MIKKRVAIEGQGKRGGKRTLLAHKAANKAFFIYGFAKNAKNAKNNVTNDELKALKFLAKVYLDHSDAELKTALKAGALIEISLKDQSNG